MPQILIAGGVIFLVFFSAFLILLYRQSRPVKGTTDHASRARALTKSIPKLREIADQFSSEEVVREAHIFLREWEEIQEKIGRMRRLQREEFLASLYYTRVEPILKQHKLLQSQTRRNTK